jgi:hypothetical protein
VRAYAQVMPVFYLRGSGKDLRGNIDAIAVAGYLFAAPASNMIGLYLLELGDIVSHLGMPLDRAEKALAAVCKTGIAKYDRAASLLYMPEGARVQMNLRAGTKIKAGDKRMKVVSRELDLIGAHPFADEFRARYVEVVAPEQGDPSTESTSSDGASANRGMGHPVSGSSPGMGLVPDPVPDPVPQGGPGEPPGGPLSDDERAVLAELQRYPALASVTKPSLARGWWASAVMAKRGLPQIAAAIAWVASDATTKAADGTPRTHEDIRDHLSALVVSWKGSGDDRGHGQPAGPPSPAGTPWRAPRNVVPIRAGGERP